MSILVAISCSFLTVNQDDHVQIPTDTFYYNRTDSGSENGKMEIDYYGLDIYRGTSFEHYDFKERSYDEDEQEYMFVSTQSDTLYFFPSDRQMKVNGEIYYINSTIASKWWPKKKK